MRKRMIVKNIFLIFLFLFSSCSPGFNYEKSYESGNYDVIIEHAESELASRIDKTHLYYKMVSHYRLGEYDQAVECAQLYYAMFNDDKGKEINDALSIMLYHSENDVEMSIYAGRLLTEAQGARTDDYAAYFIALMDGGRFRKLQIFTMR